MPTLYPIKGSVSWNKATGMIQSSGLVPPGSGMSNIGVGDEVTLVFNKSVTMSDGGIRTYRLVTTPELLLFDWRCVSNGWIFNARNELSKDILGEYASIFQCAAEYKATKLNTDITEFLETLILYDESHTRKTSSPYATSSSLWWRLADIVDWALPDLANVYVTSLGLKERTSSVAVVKSHVPLVNQLFWLDGFNETVSMLPHDLPRLSTGTSNVSISPYLDLTDLDTIDILGNKGDPAGDLREDGVGGIYFLIENSGEVDSDDLDTPFSTYLRDRSSASVWFTDSSRRKSSQILALYNNIGSAPLKMDPRTETFIRDLLVLDNWAHIYGDIINTSFDYNIEYYNVYSAGQNLQENVSYSFNACHPDINPFTHVTPLISQTAQFTVRSRDLVTEALMAALGQSNTVTTEQVGYTAPTYSWLEDNEKIEGEEGLGVESALYRNFNEAEFTSCKANITTYNTKVDCSGEGIPYLFTRTQTETVNYQVGIFLLNLNSMFWVTPDGGTNIAATDPNGTRIWVGPYDNPKGYAMAVPTILTLYKLYSEHQGDPLYEALCIYSKQQMFMKEADIVVAAMCNSLSKSSPWEYQNDFEQYYKTVKNWFDGQFMRLNGLQYSYSGSHPGLSAAFNALAEKQGEAKIDKIMKRLFPGSNIADAKDAAGGAYCKDLLRWITENGLVRMAYGVEAGSGDSLIKFCEPLKESKATTTFTGGSVKTTNTNLISGNISIQEVPAAGHPELVYIPPRYVQVSTIDREEETGSTHRVLATKVLRWDTATALKEAYEQRLLGKNIVMMNTSTDYGDSAMGLSSELGNCMSDITIRTFKISVSGEGTVMLSKSQLAQMD